VGKIPTRVDDLGVDLLSIAGHKLYAPKGVGALYVRPGLRLENFCHGAGQEKGRRGGTENVALSVGLGMACAMAARNLDEASARMRAMRERLHKGLAAGLDDLELNGHRVDRLPNTLSLSFPGLAADRLLNAIHDDIAASAGAACHADSVTISHVLSAMQVPAERAKGTVRFSVGKFTTKEEIDQAAAVIVAAVKRLRAA